MQTVISLTLVLLMGQTAAASDNAHTDASMDEPFDDEGDDEGDDDAYAVGLPESTETTQSSTAAPVAARAHEATDALEDVMVTARRRDEQLEQVPIAVTVLGEKDIEDANIKTMEDVASLTPGFNVEPLFGGTESTPVIRGLSTTIGEANVGFFIDGVYQSSRSALSTLVGPSVERIEIARGPQNALFGRSTFGGAVNYITRPPSDRFELNATATLGNDAYREIGVTASGPVLGDAVRIRAGVNYEGHEGYYTNELVDRPLDPSQNLAYSASLFIEPSKALEIVGRVAYSESRRGDTPMRYIENNAIFFPALNDYQIYTGELPSLTDGFSVTPGHVDLDDLTTSLSLRWKMETVTLASITGFNRLNLDSATDNDYEARSIRFNDTRELVREFSQELRLEPTNVGWLSWLVGSYFYYNDDLSKVNDEFVGIAEELGGLHSRTLENVLSIAFFAHVEAEILKNLRLGLEGRYAFERKTVTAVDTQVIDGSEAVFEDGQNFHHIDPRLTLEYLFTKDKTIYASVARSTKSGGFNVLTASGSVAPDEREYSQEYSWNYEIGAKTRWFNRRLRLGVAAFFVDWKDQIVRALGRSLATLNANVGASTSKGLEFEVEIRPTSGLHISGGAALVDARYEDYNFGALAQLGIDPDLSGERLNYAPQWMANASVQYRRPNIIGSLGGVVRVDVLGEGNSAVWSALLPPSWKVNTRIGLEGDRYSISFWTRNLFDDDVPTSGVLIPSWASRYDTSILARSGYVGFNALVTAPEPRSFGVTLSARY
ncbi:MAG: TonB-dependent receptor [Deltaproteobacteria bacterium]|nr:TonB-dependent receptor [Deltaproteobacteria bacterium]